MYCASFLINDESFYIICRNAGVPGDFLEKKVQIYEFD